MSLNKEKAVREYLEYLYGDVIDDEMYAPDVFQSKKDFLAGYKAAEPRWYDTKDKLPENDRIVLVKVQNMENSHWSGTRTGQYQNKKWWFDDYVKGESIKEWMEIPE